MTTRKLRAALGLGLIALVTFTGCHPTQPFYFREDGDLSHLLEFATDIEHPDVVAGGIPDATMSQRPLTVNNAEYKEIWDLSLEECVHIALKNTKTVRTLQGVTPFGIADALLGRTSGSATIYDPAITETDPQQGVEAALSAFDAQVSTSLFWETRDRPQNFDPGGFVTNFFPAVSIQNQGTFLFEINKRSAGGGQWFVRNRTIHDDGNQGGASRAVPTTWETNYELEVRQPLMRGRGAQVNRVPVMLARINTDIRLASFEGQVLNMLLDIETAYWDLECAYRAVETAKAGRDAAQATWQRIKALQLADARGGDKQAEAQARERYFQFRELLEAALGGNPSTGEPGLLARENRLRFLMGLAATDGRLIRPSDEPTAARVEFEWHEIQSEMLARQVNLRQQRWQLKQREMQLLQAKNQLLPQLDVVALYRFLGIGDHLISGRRNGLNFPNLQEVRPDGTRVFGGSTSYDELLGGQYQEARIGVQMTLPVGFRNELNNVRNVQLLIKRDTAVLEDMELNASHLLSEAIRGLDASYKQARTHFARWQAAEDEVEATEALLVGNRFTIDQVLDSISRRAQAQIDFYRAVCEHQKAIAAVHFRKGSLMEYNNISLAEGPWPKKAYWDAMGRARERDASLAIDYGFTRPRVISRGPQQPGTNRERPFHSGSQGAEEVPAPQPDDQPQDGDVEPLPNLSDPVTAIPAGGLQPIAVQTTSPVRNAATLAPAPVKYDWGGIGLSIKQRAETRTASRPAPAAVQATASDWIKTSNPLRPVSYDQP